MERGDTERGLQGSSPRIDNRTKRGRGASYSTVRRDVDEADGDQDVGAAIVEEQQLDIGERSAG